MAYQSLILSVVVGLALAAHRSVAVTAGGALRFSLGHAIGSVPDISGRGWALAVLAVATAVSMTTLRVRSEPSALPVAA